MSDAFAGVLTIFTGLLTVAIVALIVSKNADTGNIITTFTGGFAKDLTAATGPVTGGTVGSVGIPNLGIGG